MLITHQLYLYMLGRAHILLYKHRIIAKGIEGFALSRTYLLFKFSIVAHHAHTLAATACRCFYQYGVAYAVSYFAGFVHICKRLLGTRNHGYVEFLCGLLGAYLAAHDLYGVRRRAYERKPCIRYCFRERSILTEEAITGVYGICTCL